MEFTTQNGQKMVEIKAASFKDAADLKKAVLKSLKDIGIDLNNLDNIQNANVIETITQLLLNIDISEEFERALFKCLENCIYDKFYKITPQLFDDKPETREDYYEIAANCVEVNLRPFFKSLVSALKQKFKTMQKEDTQKQE